MSKVIYLDGTETLVLTREMVLGYRDTMASPINDWEATLLMMIVEAHKVPGTTVVGRYEPMSSPPPRQIEQLVNELFRSRFLSIPSNRCQFRVYAQEMVLQFFTANRGPTIHDDLKRIDLGWNSFP